MDLCEEDESYSLLQVSARLRSAVTGASTTTMNEDALSIARAFGTPGCTIPVWSCLVVIFVVLYCIYAIQQEPLLAQIRSYELQLILYIACLLLSPRLWCFGEWGQQIGMVWQTIFEAFVLMIAFVSLPSCVAAYKVRCATTGEFPQSQNVSDAQRGAQPSFANRCLPPCLLAYKRRYATKGGCLHGKHDSDAQLQTHAALAREAQSSLQTVWLLVGFSVCLRIVVAFVGNFAAHMQWTWFPSGVPTCLITAGLLLVAIVIGMCSTIANANKMRLGSIKDYTFEHALVSSTLLVAMAFQDLCFPLIFKNPFARSWFVEVMVSIEVSGAVLLHVLIFEATMVKLRSALSLRFRLEEKQVQNNVLHRVLPSPYLQSVAMVFVPSLARPAVESTDEPVDWYLSHVGVGSDAEGQANRQHNFRTSWRWVLCDFFSIRVRSRFLPCLIFSSVLLFVIDFENSSAMIANTELLNTAYVLVGGVCAWMSIGLFTLSNNIYWSSAWAILTMIFALASCVYYLLKMSTNTSVSNGLLGVFELFTTVQLYSYCCAYLLSIGAVGLIAFLLLQPNEEVFFFQALVSDASAYARWLFKPTQNKSQEFFRLGKRLYGTAVRFPPLMVLSFLTTFLVIAIGGCMASTFVNAVLADIQIDQAWTNAIVGKGPWELDEAKHALPLLEALDIDGDGRWSKEEARLAAAGSDVRLVVEPMLAKYGSNEIGVNELATLLRRARMRYALVSSWRAYTDPLAGAQDVLAQLDVNRDGLLEQGVEFSMEDCAEALRDSSVLSMPPQMWAIFIKRLPMVWQNANADCGDGSHIHGIINFDAAQLACFVAQVRYEAMRIQVTSWRASSTPHQSLISKNDARGFGIAAGAEKVLLPGFVHKFLYWAIESLETTVERVVIIVYCSLLLSAIFALYVLFKPFAAHVRWYENMQRGERDTDIPADVLRSRFDYATFFPGVYFSTVLLGWSLILTVSFLLLLLVTCGAFWQIMWSYRTYLAAYLTTLMFTLFVLRKLMLDKYCVEDGVVVKPIVFACVWCALTLYNFATGVLLAVSRIIFILPYIAFKLCEFDTCILPGWLQVFDVGYASYEVLNFMNYETTQPLHVAFLMALIPDVFMLRSGITPKSPEERRKKLVRNRWHLARLLIQNGSLVKHRKRARLFA